jgi:hypothetical protein
MEEPRYFDIVPSSTTKASLAEQDPALSCHLGADIVILPSRPQHQAFFTGTIDLRNFIRDQGASVDIWTTDETYKEIALHSVAHWLGTFLVQTVAVTLFLNVVSSYVFEWLRAKDDDTLEIHVIVEKSGGGSTEIQFRGPVEKFEKVVEAAKSLSHE